MNVAGRDGPDARSQAYENLHDQGDVVRFHAVGDYCVDSISWARYVCYSPPISRPRLPDLAKTPSFARSQHDACNLNHYTHESHARRTPQAGAPRAGTRAVLVVVGHEGPPNHTAAQTVRPNSCRKR